MTPNNHPNDVARKIINIRTYGRLIPISIALLGILVRTIYISYNLYQTSAGEAENIAITYSRTGMFAGAYFIGEGPTAHLLPIPVLIAGSIYQIFGEKSILSEVILAGISVSLVLASFVFLYLAFFEMGMPRWAATSALAILCLFPVNIWLETISLRVWDSAYGTSVAALFLFYAVRTDHAAFISMKAILGLAVLAALLFFISPQLGIGAYACALLLMVRRTTPKRWPLIALVAVSALATVIAPWAIRNERVFGQPMLRSNLGLELALAFHSGAAGGDDKESFLTRKAEIHPYNNPVGHAKMVAAGGEVPYAQMLGQQAKAWIATHPKQATLLATKYLRQHFFPPAWEWQLYGSAGTGVYLKLALTWLLSTLGLIGAVWALVWLRGCYVYAVLMLIIPALPYAMVVPILRYNYSSFALLVYFAMLAVWTIGRSLGGLLVVPHPIERSARIELPQQRTSTSGPAWPCLSTLAA